MTFPLGKPIAAMLVIAIITGVAMWFRPEDQRTDYTVWLFSEGHARMLAGAQRRTPAPESPVAQFEKATGRALTAKLVGGRGMDIRLLSMFNDPDASNEIPDVVFIEIGSVGKFFRPPVDQVGLYPLNDLLKQSGWYDRIVNARFAPWSKEDVIFGVPVDLHPVSLTYRKDLFDEAGVDLEAPKTWAEFQQACLKFTDYWRKEGAQTRHAIQLQSAGADDLTIMLLQRGINLIDQHNRVHLTDPTVLETLLFYVQLVAGPNRIATDSSPGAGSYVRDVQRGDIGSLMTPDWSVNYLRMYGPDLPGKLRMRPLPIFDPGDSPTSTWGGTCMAIPRAAKDPKASWEIIERLWLTQEAQRFHRQHSAVLPPVRESWNDPSYHVPDPLYGGQKIMELYVQLADQIPARHVTPFSVYAVGRLGIVVDDVVTRLESGNTKGIEDYARKQLQQAQIDVEELIKFTLGKKE